MNALRLFLLTLAIIILAGCPASETITLYNNSKDKVTVELDGKDFSWAPQEEIHVSDKGTEIGWEELQWQGDPATEYFPLLVLSVGDEKKKYKLVFPDLPKRFIASGKDGRNYSLQLDDGMKLYIVPGDSKLPVSKPSLKILLAPQKH